MQLKLMYNFFVLRILKELVLVEDWTPTLQVTREWHIRMCGITMQTLTKIIWEKQDDIIIYIYAISTL